MLPSVLLPSGRSTLSLVLLLAGAAAQEVCAPELCTGAGQPRCPIGQGLASARPAKMGLSMENVYFRNAAPFPAEILRVDELGIESSMCVRSSPLPTIPPKLLLSLPTNAASR